MPDPVSDQLASVFEPNLEAGKHLICGARPRDTLAPDLFRGALTAYACLAPLLAIKSLMAIVAGPPEGMGGVEATLAPLFGIAVIITAFKLYVLDDRSARRATIYAITNRRALKHVAGSDPALGFVRLDDSTEVRLHPNGVAIFRDGAWRSPRPTPWNPIPHLSTQHGEQNRIVFRDLTNTDGLPTLIRRAKEAA